MGCRKGDFLNDETSSSSLSEALIFATLYIIGLPVDVHVKDGSVYSGIFHTASVEDEYGIVLKNATMTKMGKCKTNVANGVVIDTLVILSGDLVQVIAEGVRLSVDGIAGNMTGDCTEAVVGIVPSEHPLNEAKKSTKSAIQKRKINHTRTSALENGFSHAFMPKISGRKHEEGKSSTNQIGNALEIYNEKIDEIKEASGVSDGRSEVEQDIYKDKIEFHREERADEVQRSISCVDTSITRVQTVEDAKITSQLFPNEASGDSTATPAKLDNQCCERPSSAETSSSDTVSPGLSTSTNPIIDVTSESSLSSSTASTEMVPPQNPESNKNIKEFKLNPGAKIFSPSLASPISANPPVPTVASRTYIPNTSPAVPVAAAQPEIEFSPFVSRSSVPVKFVPYGNLPGGNGTISSQFSQPIVGPVGSRTQPLRYAGQYNPVQAGTAYTHPAPQAVMVGRFGQLVYVHPVSHDLAQGASISLASARPPLTPNLVQFPKQQGSAASQALHLSAPPPFIASGQQPFAVPSHAPLLQPGFPANRPIPVPGANGLYSTKFT